MTDDETIYVDEVRAYAHKHGGLGLSSSLDLLDEIKRLRDLLQQSLEAVTSPECLNVFSLAAVHGHKYRGPVVPVDEIREALGKSA